MAIVDTPRVTATPSRLSAGRDTGIDLLRAVCVVGVVLLHAIMVGVTVVDGAPVFVNASEGTRWIVPVSWLLQVMPLFFIIGGFAGLLAYRRQRDRGASASAFIAGRVHRLLRPAVVTIGAVGIALGVLSAVGVPAELIVIAGFRYGQPLWFLAVFLLCQALLPALARAHESMPKTTLGALALAAVLVDTVRAQTGLEGVGFVNLAFVWLALQQIGFFLADGTLDRLSGRTRALGGAAALIALVCSFVGGVHSPDLIANINPPTTALLLVGIVHLSAVSLLGDRIRAISRRPAVATFSSFVNRRTMTIYLWHMPVLLAMAGLSAVWAATSGIALPAPSSTLWWASRPLWLASALVLTALVAVVFTRVETRPSPSPTQSIIRVCAATALGLGGVLLLLVGGTSVLTATIAGAALLFAGRLARSSGQSARSERVTHIVGVA